MDTTIEKGTEQAASEADADLGSIKDNIATLKRDVGNLLTQLTRLAARTTGDATRKAEDWAEHKGEDAMRLADDVVEKSARTTKAAIHQIEQQPVRSLVVAFALGIVAARVFSR